MWFAEFIESEHVIAKVEIMEELVGVIMVREAIGAAERVGISVVSNILIDVCEFQV
jgi:hypothetical protein